MHTWAEPLVNFTLKSENLSLSFSIQWSSRFNGIAYLWNELLRTLDYVLLIYCLLWGVIRVDDNNGVCLIEENWFLVNIYIPDSNAVEPSYISVCEVDCILCNVTSAPFSPCCRRAWSSTEKDLHQMGKLSFRQSDLSHRWLIYWPAWWPHAYPSSGSALRRTAGKYHMETTPPFLNPDPDPHCMTPTLLHKSGGRRNHVLHFFFLLPVWCTSPSASTCFSLFKFLPLVPPHVFCYHMGVDHFSSAPRSQSPPKAACVSTAWRMLIKPCSF